MLARKSFTGEAHECKVILTETLLKEEKEGQEERQRKVSHPLK